MPLNAANPPSSDDAGRQGQVQLQGRGQGPAVDHELGVLGTGDRLEGDVTNLEGRVSRAVVSPRFLGLRFVLAEAVGAIFHIEDDVADI